MGRNFRPFVVLVFVLVLLLLLRKGGDLTVARPDLEVDLEPLPDLFLPSIFLPRGMRETTDALCDCGAAPLVPGVTIYSAVPEVQPDIQAVYVYASPNRTEYVGESVAFGTHGL